MRRGGQCKKQAYKDKAAAQNSTEQDPSVTETTEQTRQRSMAQSPKRKDQGSPKKIHIVSKSSSLGKDIHVIKMNSSISSQLQKNDTKSV